MTDDLPAAFTLSQAQAAGQSKTATYAMVDAGHLDRVGRGVFADPARIDPVLAVLAGATAAQPTATLCLTSALVWHGLSDQIPQATDIALSRGTRHPAGFNYAAWHSFDPATFSIGREAFHAAGMTLHAYSPERTIIDCFRLAHLEGPETATAALKLWLRQRGHAPSSLVAMADAFPRAQTRIRQALETLL